MRLPVVVIPVAVSRTNPELDLALHQLAKYHPGTTVALIGHHPPHADYDLTLRHIPTRQGADRFTNTATAMRTALNDETIPDTFLWSNDDVYLTRALTAADLTPWHQGELPTEPGRNRYTQRKYEARLILEHHGLPTLDYELHTPILIHKDVMTRALELGGTMRTMYGNLTGAGEYHPDVKVRTVDTRIPNGPYISSGHKTLRRVKRHLA